MNRLRLWLMVLCGAAAAFPVRAQYGFPSFADLAEKLIPTVVNISTIQQPDQINIPAEGSNGGGEYYDPLEGRVALGSGFIISEDGYIITNYHVIENAEVVNVVLFDNTEVEADIIGGDEKTDIALIKIEPPFELDKVTFGDSDAIRVGDWVLAIGNPFGLGGSVTPGIVSAKSRDIAAGPYDNFIQTDAAINQGSSGGPMFNTKGEVIGINSALFSTSGNNMGIGFAIPINIVEWIVKQLEQSGEVKRGWIGIRVQPNSKNLARSLNLKDSQGIIVSGISENGPAAKAGLQAGDVIISLGQTEINSCKDFSRLIAEMPAGSEAQLVIWRNQEIEPITVKVENMPKSPKAAPREQVKPDSDGGKILKESGMILKEITPEIVKNMNLSPTTMGLLVEGVEFGSDADRQGIKRGDIILKMDLKDCVTLSAALGHIQDAQTEKRPLHLMIQNAEQDEINVLQLKLRP
mgnify:FL=1